MKQYLEVLKKIVGKDGVLKLRTAQRMYFNLKDGFPIVTTKEIWWKQLIVPEVVRLLNGYTSPNNVPEDIFPDDLWWSWTPPKNYSEQLAEVVNDIKNRLRKDKPKTFVCSWNTTNIPGTREPYSFQFWVHEGGLFCHVLMQRSSILGAPDVIASCALLIEAVAQVCALGVGEISFIVADTYVPEHRKEEALQQTRRKPCTLPKLELNPGITTIKDFTPEDFKLVGYRFHSGAGIQGT